MVRMHGIYWMLRIEWYNWTVIFLTWTRVGDSSCSLNCWQRMLPALRYVKGIWWPDYGFWLSGGASSDHEDKAVQAGSWEQSKPGPTTIDFCDQSGGRTGNNGSYTVCPHHCQLLWDPVVLRLWVPNWPESETSICLPACISFSCKSSVSVVE